GDSGTNSPRLMFYNSVSGAGTGIAIHQTGANNLHFRTGATPNSTSGTSRMVFSSAALYPTTSGGLTLGTSGLPWGAAYMGALTLGGTLDMGSQNVIFNSVSGGSNLIEGNVSGTWLFRSRFDSITIQGGINDANPRDINFNIGDTLALQITSSNSADFQGNAVSMAALTVTAASASTFQGDSDVVWNAATIYFTNTGASNQRFAVGTRGNYFSISDETSPTGLRFRITGNGAVLIGSPTGHSDSAGNLAVEGALTATTVTASGLIKSTANEGARFAHDGAFITFWNTANSVRSGYLQIQAAAAATLNVQVNQLFTIRTNNTIRFTVAAGGDVTIVNNVLIGTTTAATGSPKLDVVGDDIVMASNVTNASPKAARFAG
ncbi:hypothetical protein LCGC14_2937870, partial [marine sediment metagenome]